MDKFTGLVRRCADDYGMIEEGDQIAVGLSGGKDSLSLLVSLAHLKTYYPKSFALEAVTLDMGFEGMDFSGLENLCARLDVPFTLVRTNLRKVVFEDRAEKNPCSLCAKMRRGALNDAAKARGCNKVALGHHFDDAVETFVMSLVYEGRIGCFMPVTYMSRSDITQIRPLLYVGERTIGSFARRYALSVVQNPCPSNGKSRRQDVKELLAALDKSTPGIKARIFGGMQRLPLDGWSVKGQ